MMVGRSVIVTSILVFVCFFPFHLFAADIEVESIHIQEVLQNVQIPVTIRNTGGSFQPFIMEVYIDREETDTPNSTLQIRPHDYGFDSSCDEFSFPVVVARNLSPGAHNIIVKIDPHDAISEEYENNNMATRTVWIQEAQEQTSVNVDLGIEDIVGSGNQVKVYVNNLGNAPVTDEYTFTYKVNYDNQLKTFTQQINAEAGGFAVFTIEGFTLAPGSNRIWLKIDESDIAYETNPNNNELTRTLFPQNSDIQFLPYFFFGEYPAQKLREV